MLAQSLKLLVRFELFIFIERTARNIMMFNKQMKDFANTTMLSNTISPKHSDT